MRLKTAAFGLTTIPAYVAFALFLSLIHALLEEYYWRAFVFAEMIRLVSTRPAIVASSIGFAAHHIVVLAVYFPDHFLSVVIPLSLAVAAGGVIWAWMYRRYASIYPGWLSHAFVDAGIMTVGGLIVWR